MVRLYITSINLVPGIHRLCYHGWNVIENPILIVYSSPDLPLSINTYSHQFHARRAQNRTFPLKTTAVRALFQGFPTRLPLALGVQEDIFTTGAAFAEFSRISTFGHHLFCPKISKNVFFCAFLWNALCCNCFVLLRSMYEYHSLSYAGICVRMIRTYVPFTKHRLLCGYFFIFVEYQVSIVVQEKGIY